KASCLYHIIQAVDVEPVTCRIEHSDWILPFQELLEQLGDAGLAIAWLGQEFHDDIGDVHSGSRGDFEESHPDAVDRFFGDVISQVLEVDLGVKGFSRIGNGAFGKPTEAGIAGLLLPVAVDEYHAVIRLLAE